MRKYIEESIKIVLPGVIGLIGILLGGYLAVDKPFRYWSLLAAYFFPPLGKESVIPLGIAAGIHPLVMALSVAFIDIVVALFLMWNYDFAKKIPFIGPFIEKVENIGRSSSNKYSWIKPLRFIGIVLFVMVPFQGSGGVVGSILGRLIGMSPLNTFLAITTGSITGCILIAYFAETIKIVFLQNFILGLILVILILIIGIMVVVYMRNRNKVNKTRFRR
ncbi:MAG: hypothetical protein DRN12_05055 [Thermoplasmata archaeon]|nr:MAG: hypothetical protein DRN12_05055 [Thermoplasmata archaeon]HEC89559.1 hypothetical protein [Thermoplasmatales archaeon]